MANSAIDSSFEEQFNCSRKEDWSEKKCKREDENTNIVDSAGICSEEALKSTWAACVHRDSAKEWPTAWQIIIKRDCPTCFPFSNLYLPNGFSG